MSRVKDHQRVDGHGLSFTNGGFLTRGGNLRKWTNFENGASLVPSWQGETDVASLGYTDQNTAEIKMASFTVSRDVGPTASGRCSPGKLTVAPTTSTITDGFYWLDNGVKQTQGMLQTQFTGAGGTVGQNQPKPSNLHILFGIWFSYNAAAGFRGHGGAGHAAYKGTFEFGLGAGGDVIYFENLTTGAVSRVMSGTNALITSGTLNQSTDWIGGGIGLGAGPRAIWMQALAQESDEWRVSIRPPGWGKEPFNGTDEPHWPIDMTYYVAVYVLEGCTFGAQLTPGHIVGGSEIPVYDVIRHLDGAASVGGIRL